MAGGSDSKVGNGSADCTGLPSQIYFARGKTQRESPNDGKMGNGWARMAEVRHFRRLTCGERRAEARFFPPNRDFHPGSMRHRTAVDLGAIKRARGDVVTMATGVDRAVTHWTVKAGQ